MGSDLAISFEGASRAALDCAYWLERLRDLPEPLLEPVAQPAARARCGFTLPADAADALRGTAARLSVTTARLLTALAAVAVARWYQRPDLIFALTQRAAGRRPAAAPLAETMPLRLRIDVHKTLGETIEAVAQSTRADQRHRAYPMHALRAALGLAPDRPLGDVTLTYLPVGRAGGMDGAAPRVEHASPAVATAWGVTWIDAGIGTGLGTTVEHDAAAIAPFEGDGLAEALHCLMRAAPVALDSPVAALPLMREATRQKLLGWSAGARVVVPADATLASLFAEQARRTPHATALVCHDERLDYATLHARATHLAAHLAAAGIRRGSVVGLALPRTEALLVGVLATHMAGAAYLPLDPALPPERLAFMCADARAALVLTTEALEKTLPPLPCRLARLDVAADFSPASGTEAEAPAPDDLAYVLYTSGSTGRPKGVAVEHRSLVNFLFWARSLVEPEDLSAVLFATTLAFDISVIELFLPLAFGGRVVMVDNILALPAAPARAEVRLISTVPSLLEALLRVHALPPGLRTLFLGGEALHRDLANRVMAERPDLRVGNLYGPTEATVYASFAWLTPGEAGPPPIGRPIWNSSLHVLDALGEPLPPGAVGELWIGGAPVARGYLDRPDLTDARFRPDPFGGGRMYGTGDRARWRQDGQVEFLGRRDEQIKINGVRVELGEVEAALRALPGIAAAAAALRADEAGPHGLVGWLVAAPGAAPRDAAALRAELRAHLPEMMIPASFVWADALPLTANGKLDRKALRHPPSSAEPRHRASAEPAPSATQRAVAELWAQVLQRSDLADDDDFFDFGGDSLAAVNLLAQVEARFGVRLATDVLAEGLTVARLTGLIEAEGQADPPGLLLPLQPYGDAAPFYCVPGVGGDPTQLRALARRMGIARPVLALRGGLAEAEPDRIEDIAARYVDALLARHPGGPILLGGYSLGAAIAFEMAQQLRARDRAVALLALIDARRPDWRLSAGNLAPTLFEVFRNLPRWVRDDLAPGGWETFLRNLRRHVRVLLRPSATLDRVLDTARYTPLQQETMRRFHAALRRYRPAPYPGRVTVLRARAQPLLWWFDEPTLGWREVARDGVELFQLPGNHATIMGEPIVARLAERLRACLAHAAPEGGDAG